MNRSNVYNWKTERNKNIRAPTTAPDKFSSTIHKATICARSLGPDVNSAQIGRIAAGIWVLYELK